MSSMAKVKHNGVIAVLGLLVWLSGQQTVSAAQSSPQEKDSAPAFHIFRSHSLAQGPQLHRYYQNQWKALYKKRTSGSTSSRRFFPNGGGVGLPLAHRDARDSPFRAASSTNPKVRGAPNQTRQDPEYDFTTIFGKSLQRDVARVRAIDAIISKRLRMNKPANRFNDSSPKSRSTLRGKEAPLKSPVVSGLDFGSGEYFTSLAFGSPATEMLVTIDTGSDLVWLQCHPCASCYDQIGPIFDPGASESYEAEPCFSRACGSLPRSACDGFNCEYTESYGDGSYSRGELATETVTLNSTGDQPVQIPGILFGCGHDNQGLFTASAGLLGLGRGSLSFPSQIAQDVAATRFSYCLKDRFAATVTAVSPSSPEDGDTDGTKDGEGSDKRPKKVGVDGTGDIRRDTNAGNSDGNSDGSEDGEIDELTGIGSYLFFGNAEGCCDDMKYTGLLHNPSSSSFYYVRLTGISIGNELLPIPASSLELDSRSGRGGVILDTGTAITRLSPDAYITMRDVFREKTKRLKRVFIPEQELFDTCFHISDGQPVPSVTLHFDWHLDLLLPLDNVVIPVDDSGSLYCFAFGRSESRSDFTIIGNVQQQGFRIEFDLAKSRVGFTQQGCSLP